MLRKREEQPWNTDLPATPAAAVMQHKETEQSPRKNRIIGAHGAHAARTGASPGGSLFENALDFVATLSMEIFPRPQPPGFQLALRQHSGPGPASLLP